MSFQRFIVRRKSDGLWKRHARHTTEWVSDKDRAQLHCTVPSIKAALCISFWYSNEIRRRKRESGLMESKFRKELRPEFEEWFNSRYEIFEVSLSK